MTITLEDVKGYCRIDGDEDDALVQSFIEAAKGYLDGAGVPDPEVADPLYLLAVRAMVLHFYDQRGMTQSTVPSEIPGIRNTITQLKLRAEARRAVEVEPWPTV